MRVDIGFMFESNGNWFCNVAIANDQCKNFLDTNNYVEFGYGQNVRSAIDRAAKARMVLDTGQPLLDPEECSLLVSQNVMSKEEIHAIYEQVGMLYERF